MKTIQAGTFNGRYSKGIMSAGVFSPDQLRYLDEELEKLVAVIANHSEVIEDMAFTEDQIDSTTNAVMVVDYAHHEIHSGSHYKAGRQDTSLATSDTIEVLFVTPDTTKWAHWVMTSQTTGECVVELFEDTVTSADGTAITPTNRNRNSANTATVTVTHTPTITSDGTKLSEKWIGSTGFKEDSGGEARGDSELLLKQNTKYLIRLTAVGDGIKGAIGGDWYEHTNK